MTAAWMSSGPMPAVAYSCLATRIVFIFPVLLLLLLSRRLPWPALLLIPAVFLASWPIFHSDRGSQYTSLDALDGRARRVLPRHTSWWDWRSTSRGCRRRITSSTPA